MCFIRRLSIFSAILTICPLALPLNLSAQTVSFAGTRVFVTGFTPIIGPGGGVGGVAVDPSGALERVVIGSDGRRERAQQKAAPGIPQNVQRRSQLRKVSLTRLEAEIARRIERQTALSTDLLFLAGLQRIACIFVCPDARDIVIAGPAEGWKFSGSEAIGISSGAAVLRLDDLLDAMQSRVEIAGAEPITCSIDPDPEGMARLGHLLRRPGLQVTEESLAEMERQLGDHVVTVTGVRNSSHFARVMVSADYLMKRIAMDLEADVSIPSYMQLLQRRSAANHVASPRWWLAAHYEKIARSEDGLTWQFHGDGLRAHSEHGYLDRRGKLVSIGKPTPLAARWADLFTGHYTQLSKQFPVFGQLSGCVDLVMLSALVRRYDLIERAGCALPLLTDAERIRGEEFAVPRSVASQGRALRSRRGWVVSLSGGIDLDPNPVISQVEIDPTLAAADADSMSDPHWWWD